MAATGVRQSTALHHPRFLQGVGGLALAVLTRALIREHALGAAISASLSVLRDFFPLSTSRRGWAASPRRGGRI
jgi:hypothetical protein